MIDKSFLFVFLVRVINRSRVLYRICPIVCMNFIEESVQMRLLLYLLLLLSLLLPIDSRGGRGGGGRGRSSVGRSRAGGKWGYGQGKNVHGSYGGGPITHSICLVLGISLVGFEGVEGANTLI